MAIKDGRCYPANGPSQEQFPIGSQNISIPLKTSSAYYNQEILQPQTLSPTHQTVFIDGEPKYHILEANKEGQHFEAFNGIAHFDTITVTAKSVTFVNVTATTFIWHTASQESYCTNCGKISLLPYNGQRFFKCSGNPTFTGVDANVLAPTCSCAFINSSVICLRDKSSPEQSYTNTDVTDLTVSTKYHAPLKFCIQYTLFFQTKNYSCHTLSSFKQRINHSIFLPFFQTKNSSSNTLSSLK